MKQLIVLLPFLLGLNYYAYSQKLIQKTLDVQGKKVEMKFSFADTIAIEAWTKNTIELEVSVNIDSNRYNDYYEMKVKDQTTNLVLEEVINFEAIQKKRGDQHNLHNSIIYKLKVPANLEFKLNTIAGQVELKGSLGKMSVNSVSGFIDYAVPQNCKAKIDLSTVTGNVYSNLKFDDKPNSETMQFATNRKLVLNGGTQDIALKTVSGDIYLRKGK
jgi:predicted membrane protein